MIAIAYIIVFFLVTALVMWWSTGPIRKEEHHEH